MRPIHKADLAKVELALAGLDIRDRCVVLTASIVRQNPNTFFGVIFGFINLITQLSRPGSVKQRFRVAEALRNAADDIERQTRDERCQVQ